MGARHLQSDASGSVSRLLDNIQVPADKGSEAIAPGSTWSFQYWYRDPAAGGTGFNISNNPKATVYP